MKAYEIGVRVRGWGTFRFFFTKIPTATEVLAAARRRPWWNDKEECIMNAEARIKDGGYTCDEILID